MEHAAVIDTLRCFHEESGVDGQFDLRVLQVIGIARDEARILRVYFNDGRIRDWDCGKIISEGNGRFAVLADGDSFMRMATVWDGAPGFDLGGCHDRGDCIDFDPYVVWVESKDVTRQVLEQECMFGRSDLMASDGELPSVAETTSEYCC